MPVNFNDFDDFLNNYYEEIRNEIAKVGDNLVDYKQIIESVKQKYQNVNRNGRIYPDSIFKPQEEESVKNIINEKIKTMNVGQSNLKEATKYSQYYGYKVSVNQHRYSDKNNYVFALDNSFIKKLLKKPSNRMTFNHDYAIYHTITFHYKPKAERKMIDDTMVHFHPYDITLTTEGCQDFVFYHIPNNGESKEVLKALYILNVDKVIEKLNSLLDETDISDKGKLNMALSVRKHLNNVESEARYGVSEFEDYAGLTEELAMSIVDDIDDEEVLNTLEEYIL